MKIAHLAVGLLFGVLGCGGRAVDSRSAGETGGSSDANDAGVESQAIYAGSVIATTRWYQGKQSSTLVAVFWEGELPSHAQSCGGVSIGACCGKQVRPGFLLPNIPPSAGNVTIDLAGVPLATLLGPDYPPIESATWNAGDAFHVSATGGDLAAFSGTLRTPATIAGLSPSFEQTAVTIAPNAEFRIAWTAEARAGELMQILIDADGPKGEIETVSCAVDDSVGAVVVDASLLEPLVSAKNVRLHLVRSITSNVSGRNAIIALEGNLWLNAPAAIRAP